MELSRITIYPVKSLDGVEVKSARTTAGGILENDRVYALFNEDGNWVNGKGRPEIIRLRSEFDAKVESMTLWVEGSSEKKTFSLRERGPLEKWLGDYFGFEVTVRHDAVNGFPDDNENSGPTLIAQESVRGASEWFPGIKEGEMWRRLRANLEVSGATAYWEDRLAAEGKVVPFSIGETRIEGRTICARCSVPPRDSMTSEVYPKFQKIFSVKRKETLPEWADKKLFDHFYRLMLNTFIPLEERGKEVRVGDAILVD